MPSISTSFLTTWILSLRDGFPLPCPDFFEERLQHRPVRRFFVIGDNRLLLLVLPLLPAVDFHLLNQLRDNDKSPEQSATAIRRPS